MAANGALRIATIKDCAALFPQSIEAIAALTENAKKAATAQLDKICEQQPQPATLQSAAIATDRAQAEFSVAASILSVIKNVSPSKELRDEASKRYVELSGFSIDSFSNNKKLYTVLKKYSESVEGKTELAAVHREYPYWVTDELDEFRRGGMDLPDDKRDEVAALKKEISELSTQFNTNIAEDKTRIEASEEQLAGVPPNVMGQLKRSEEDASKYSVGMDYPSFFGIMKNCKVAETRKRMADAFENRGAPKNLEVLNRVVATRHKVAMLLGFQSYTHYDLSSKMVKEPAVAQKFVDELVPKLQKKWELERAELVKTSPDVALDKDGNIFYHDVAYMMNEYKKKNLNVDEALVQEYFPMDGTVQALFDVYEEFFDVTFVKHEAAEGEWWDKQVAVLEVTDNRSKCKTGALLGFIVLDLFPREGKFTHACCHSAVPPFHDTSSDTWAPALGVVLANFPKATEEKPALFLHDDAVTFFHEFGHAIHGLMGRAHMATFAGTRVKRDFVELPSQMLEEWLWDTRILQKVTSHYKTKEKLPDELIASKIKSKNAFSGRDSLRQLQFATLSLQIFGADYASKPLESMDAQALFRDIQPQIMNGMHYSTASNFVAGFAHLMGYSACYYGYMWSEVLADDVFSYIKERDGLLSAELGRRYVDCVIGLGGGDDPNDMLKRFLGREPTNEAFLANLGIK